MYATTSPAIPVPITATFLRGSFASIMKEGKVYSQLQEKESVYDPSRD
jgi:hypothetical protein